jgi:hypothetical protein
VRLFRIKEVFFDVHRYYVRHPLFFCADMLVLLQYFWKSPYRCIRQYDEQHPFKEIGPYGETSFGTFEAILTAFSIPKELGIAELGSGRGRLCFWLRMVRNQRYVLGVEAFPLFVHRAQRVQRWFKVHDLEFLSGNWNDAAFNGIDVIYIYGSALEDGEIKKLAQRLAMLPSGTKIITISYWLDEYFEGHFRREMKTPVTFVWGETEAYLQTVET